MKEKNAILLIFLLSKSAKIKSKINEIIKKTVCLFNEKFSSIENDSIKPVNPSDKISIKFILSTVDHQLSKYFIN